MALRVTVLVNADIRTMDRKRPRAEAVSFARGRILEAGKQSAVLAKAGNNARVLDAGGRVVLPGFIDCHTHFLSLGVWSNRLDLSATRNLSDLLDAVKNRATGDAPHLSAGNVTPTKREASPFMAGSVKRRGAEAKRRARGLTGSGPPHHLHATIAKRQTASMQLVREECGWQGKTKAPWILGRGWDEAKWPEARYLTRKDLDAVSPKNPVMLIRVCGHLATLNSKGLEALGKVIGKKDVARSTGIIRERALELARYHLRPSMDEMMAGLSYSLDMGRRLGVTSVHDIIDRSKLAAYEAAHREGLLTVRATLHFEEPDFNALLKNGIHSGQGGPMIRIGGMKLYADGSFGARTAALREPYADAPKERGALLVSDAQLRAAIRDAEQGDFQLLIHAIGDRAARQVVSAFSSTLKGPSLLRHRIEHLELPGRPELQKMRRLGLWASMQPNFVGEWGQSGGMMEARLGKRRLKRADAFKAVLKARVPLVFGSDCMPLNPLYGIHSAVNAPFPDQRLTVGEAVAAFTRDAAASSYEEGFKGTLAPGTAADLVMLSEDPFKNQRRIKGIRVEATFFDGRLVWKGRALPLTASGRS